MKFTIKHEAKENTTQYEGIISYTIFHLTENKKCKAIETGIILLNDHGVAIFCEIN